MGSDNMDTRLPVKMYIGPVYCPLVSSSTNKSLLLHQAGPSGKNKKMKKN